MMSNAKIGVALVGGYLLGRTKKAKMAIGLGMFLAGRKLNLDPRQLGALVANSPVLGPLNDQVRKELVDATKSAAGAALNQRMNGLADSLHERTLALNEGGADGTGRAADEADPEPEDEPRDEPRDEARKPAAKSAKKTATTSATKSASAGKPTATDRSSKARRSASGAAKTSSKAASSRGRTSTAPGRKAASGARNKASNKASGAARTAAGRGGSNG
ncbi:hypothetical protein SAMN05216511_6709 [Streptomyces sp. KS_16]|uniref:hypothetical protein n=2 Tax=Streptomyces TaxID=1883 RepID=UPI00088CB3B9|nr:hypothetical protein [Streptomyces sp. 2321.6]PBC80671.1 hypothetical protein BX261_0512 [Streptomyces sp. 2321.6]SDR57695.1 hypothetical protein SAMN05216511_6709 [Streptomyces sp. KS_16]SEB83957.1 hypothetical protein SAMN05428940_0511 [Streptomyces sp. 2133.1]SNC61579.1 hypothetical protein SAMN06272741_0512 [Streptomyces sp. 2114.4]